MDFEELYVERIEAKLRTEALKNSCSRIAPTNIQIILKASEQPTRRNWRSALQLRCARQRVERPQYGAQSGHARLLLTREAHYGGYVGLRLHDTGAWHIAGIKHFRHAIEAGERRSGKGEQYWLQAAPTRNIWRCHVDLNVSSGIDDGYECSWELRCRDCLGDIRAQCGQVRIERCAWIESEYVGKNMTGIIWVPAYHVIWPSQRDSSSIDCSATAAGSVRRTRCSPLIEIPLKVKFIDPLRK